MTAGGVSRSGSFHLSSPLLGAICIPFSSLCPLVWELLNGIAE